MRAPQRLCKTRRQRFFIEKRAAQTGTLDAAFGTNESIVQGGIAFLAIDGDYLFAASTVPVPGDANDEAWRIDKMQRATGAI